VTVLEEGPKFGLEMAHPRRWRVLDDLRNRGVTLIADATVRSIDAKSVAYNVCGSDASVTADSVILAVGLAAKPEMKIALEAAGVPLREIGDVTGVGYLEGAMRDGFHAALELE